MTSSASAGRDVAAGFLTPHQTLGSRILGVMRQPRLTFTALAASAEAGAGVQHRRWVDVVTACTVASALAGLLFTQTDVGRQALVDQWERTAAAFGREVDDAGYARLEELSRYGAVYAVAGALATGPLLTLIVAGVIFLAGRRPGPAFGTVLTVVAHAGVVLALRQVIAAPVNYVRESTANALSLGAWFPGLDAASPVARALGVVDFFVLWWALLLAMGVAVLYGKRFQSTALAAVALYVTAAMVIAAGLALTGSSS